MKINILLLLMAIGLVLAILFSINVIKKYEDKTFEAMDYEELMAIINNAIEVEFSFKYELEYKLKDIRVLNDFQGELKEITRNVVMSFNSDFYKNIEYYHTREYVYKYITKRVEIMLMKFQDKIKVKTK